MILETVIFLVAIVGIILTYFCFLNVYENEYLNSNYLITNSKNKNGENKNIQLIINSIIFFFLKAIVFVILVIINAFDGLLDCIIGLTILWAILTLFIYDGKTTPDFIPFIPTNVEQFLYFSLIGTILEIIKIVVIKESVNILVLIQNIEDKIFVKILMK